MTERIADAMETHGLYGLDEGRILQKLGLQKKYQARQIMRWLAKGVYEFDKMTDLPLRLRERLRDEGVLAVSSEVIDSRRDETGAIKLALRLSDGQVVECVLLISESGHRTACLSSQVGCAMGCRFCRTGTMHMVRNLMAFEIIEQMIHLMRLEGSVESVVFMGMGEPLANLPEVLKAIRYFHDPEGINLSHRKITISTSGVVPGIRALCKADVPVKLAVSLVSAVQSKREELMPVARTFNLGMLKDALLSYQRHYGRRITFECCLMSGINTSLSDARRLAEFCVGLDVVVNLIPFNEAAELDFRTPGRDEVERFAEYLDRLGVQCTLRFSRGRGVNGACGQLAVKCDRLGDAED